MRNRNIAAVRPLTDCAKTNDGSGTGARSRRLEALGSREPDQPPIRALGGRGSAKSSSAYWRPYHRVRARASPAQPVLGGGSEGGQSPPPSDLVHELRGIYVLDGLEDREGVLRIHHRLAVELPAIGLVVLLADGDLAHRRVERDPEQGLGED